MILILAIELCQVSFTAIALWYTVRRWVLADRRRKEYQAKKLNGVPGFANRLRAEREWDRAEYQLLFLICGLLILTWRLFNLDRPTLDRASAVMASIVLHFPLIYGSVWAFRQTRKDLRNEGEIQAMTHEEDRRQEAARQSALTLQESVTQVSATLTEEKHARVATARALASTTAAEAASVRARLDYSAHGIRGTVDETAQSVGTHVVEVVAKAVEDTQQVLHEQTETLSGKIEEAKIYTAEKADAAREASSRAETEANQINRKIQELQKINEKHAEMLQQLLAVMQSAGLPGAAAGGVAAAEAKALEPRSQV